MYRGPALGLFTSPNPFSQTPNGTLKKADDVRFTAPGVIEPRRGFRYVEASFGGDDSLADIFAFYADTILMAYDLTNVSLYTDSWTDFDGTFLPVGANRMRFEGAARSMFFNTSQGLKAWDGVGNAGQPVNAGSPAGLDLDARPDSANGWQTANTAVAYRYTLCSKDAFGRVIEGAPSGRATLRNLISVPIGSLVKDGAGTVTAEYNSGQNPFVLSIGDVIELSPGETDFPAGPKTITAVGNNSSSFQYAEAGGSAFSTVVQVFSIATSGLLTAWLPPDATTQMFVRAYRTHNTLGSANETPGDEFFQVYESAYLSADDLAAGFVQFVDTAPESTLDVPLYTNNNNGDGALQGRYQPPKSLDITYWASRMWFANAEQKERLLLAVLGTGEPDGLTPGSDLEIYHSEASNVTFIGVDYNPLLPAPDTLAADIIPTGGTLGAGTYAYRIVATAATGSVYSLPSTEETVTIVSGATNVITVNWHEVAGATGYDIYGRTAGGELKLASVGAVESWDDDGSGTPAGALPVRPSMADFFYVRTDADPGLNIQTTAQSLVRSINLSINNSATVAVNAYYIASEGGIPGAILLQARSFGDDQTFSLFSSNTPQAWQPQLPSTPLSPPFPPPVSTVNAHAARLWYSPLGIPDAVPLGNYEPVNSDNDPILRIFPLHYRLLVFKTDGIYTCTNLEPFTITKLSAYKLLAPDSVCVLEDRVYALTDQGIVTISDSGLVEISNPIDDVFNAMMSPGDIETLAQRAFGVSYRSERQVILWVPQLNDDGTVTEDNAQAFVYSTLSEGFTRYAFGARCAAINPTTNALEFGPTDKNQLCLENKALNNLDYYDLSYFVGSPTDVDGAEVTFTHSNAQLMEVGDALRSEALDYYSIVAVDGDTVTLSGAPGWAGEVSITLYKSIACAVEFNKLTGALPADLKMVGQASFLFRENGVHDVNAYFYSEIETTHSDVTLETAGWGEFPWGGVQYGSPTKQILRVEPIPTPAAQCAQFSVGFSTRQALAKFGFLGIDVVEVEDAQVNRG